MRKSYMNALLITTAARAFDNTPGWKMDGDKIAVDGAGNPVYINSAGAEQAVKGDAISTLQREAQQHRETAATAIAGLKAYEVGGKLIDPAVAVKAIDTVSKLDAKQLIDAGEVDKVRDTIKAEYSSQLTEKDKALQTSKQKIDNMLIDSVFKGNEFIRENVAMPLDFFEASMRNNFKVAEDGSVQAFDRSGNRLMSKSNIGAYADPNEALQLLIEMHPQKDSILRATTGGGTGNGGQGGNRGGGRFMKRADFEALSPSQQAVQATLMGKGELTITD